ncbi:MAG: hypothetical protein CMH30_06645 [Micavibrio sp.]|nr:hypothetical protein [Micavibrio sp.]|tara:strand:+ start:944 stop:1267 length:324 start_codon:yes stop_codon:yes gene_type:complete
MTQAPINQDVQYHEVKYIIDKTYEQRNLTRHKVSEYRALKAVRNAPELLLLKQQIKRSFGLYRLYQRQMQMMTKAYLDNLRQARATYSASYKRPAITLVKESFQVSA